MVEQNTALGLDLVAFEISRQKFCKGLEKSMSKEYMLSISWLVTMFSSTRAKNHNKCLYFKMFIYCCGTTKSWKCYSRAGFSQSNV